MTTKWSIEPIRLSVFNLEIEMPDHIEFQANLIGLVIYAEDNNLAEVALILCAAAEIIMPKICAMNDASNGLATMQSKVSELSDYRRR